MTSICVGWVSSPTHILVSEASASFGLKVQRICWDPKTKYLTHVCRLSFTMRCKSLSYSCAYGIFIRMLIVFDANWKFASIFQGCDANKPTQIDNYVLVNV